MRSSVVVKDAERGGQSTDRPPSAPLLRPGARLQAPTIVVVDETSKRLAEMIPHASMQCSRFTVGHGIRLRQKKFNRFLRDTLGIHDWLEEPEEAIDDTQEELIKPPQAVSYVPN
jgi:hypothetical protein